MDVSRRQEGVEAWREGEPTSTGGNEMKYILLMSGTKAGVDTHHAWLPKDIDTHLEGLRAIVKELTLSGEFVATQGLAQPGEAKLVRGEKNGLPVTDGIFPEAKEFLLGYWIVDVATPERAYAIAGRLSAAPGPGGVPANMPIEVRQLVSPRPIPMKNLENPPRGSS
jgi:hypothetical protein